MRFVTSLVSMLVLAAVQGCGGGEKYTPPDDTGGEPAAFVVSGTMSGLADGSQVVVVDAAGKTYTLRRNGKFSFVVIERGATEEPLSLIDQPLGQECTIDTSRATWDQRDFRGLDVRCQPITYALGGTLTGLLPNSEAVLLNSRTGEYLTVSASGNFQFETAIPYGSDYGIGVHLNPTGQTCTVSHGTGEHMTAEVTDIRVVCSVNSFPVGGSVTGLLEGARVTLLNNAGDALTLTSDGSFTFPTQVAFGGGFKVTVESHPEKQTCTVTDGEGQVLDPVDRVVIACVRNFAVFQYLKLRAYVDEQGYHAGALTDDWFRSYGVQPVNLIYESRLLNCPTPTTCSPSSTLVAKAAATADSTGKIPVILDAEAWDKHRWHPNSPTENGLSIVQNLIQLADMFKSYNPGAKIGYYAELPQNTFGWSPSVPANYDYLNQQYLPVAAHVDHFAPSLYNYGHDGTEAGEVNWTLSAQYAINQARLMDPVKPVYAFLNPPLGSDFMSYEMTRQRLIRLRDMGYEGCILWMAGGSVIPGSKTPYPVDVTKGWFKAFTDFIAEAPRP